MESKYISDCTRNNDHINIILSSKNNTEDLNNNNNNNNKDLLATKDTNEINLNLDEVTKSQLTLKYIKSRDKSFWSTTPSLFNKYYENEENEENAKKIKELGDLFADELKKEYENLKEDHEYIVSAVGLFAPRSKTTWNRRDRKLRLSYYIANKIYSEKVKEELHGMIHYSRLISTLSKAYIKNYIKNYLENNNYKLSRILNHDRKNWCELKKKKLSCTITKPTAMEVKISPYEELKDFFDHLSLNRPTIINNDELEPCMKFNRGAIYEDKRMDLCKQVVGSTWIDKLMTSLDNNNHVEHFLLGNNIIGKKGGEEIGKFLQRGNTMKTWYLAGNDLDHEGIKLIVDGLLNDTVCTQLWLKRNPLQPEGIKEIARLMRVNKTIEILDLHNTAVFDEGLSYLMESLKENRTLNYLYLDANGISENGVGFITDYFEYLKNNNLKGITSLWIDMNKLFDGGIKKLVSVLKDYHYLERLCIGSNGISEESIDTIVDSFTNHPNLIVLDLGMYKSTSDMGMVTNNMGDNGAKKLKNLIENNNKILFMSIMMNGITKEGMDEITKSIEKNDTLLYFEHRQYNLNYDRDVFNRIINKLEENKKNYEGVIPKLRVLKHGKSIFTIDSIYRTLEK